MMGKEGELAAACWLPEITEKPTHSEVHSLGKTATLGVMGKEADPAATAGHPVILELR